QRVPARARHARPGRRSTRAEDDAGPRAALHATVTLRQRLFSLEAFGIKLGLDNMRTLVEALGHPERASPTVHVAGTNGKGSVCAIVERALRAAGYRTGLYTSPHLDRLEERMAIDGQPVASDRLDAAAGRGFAAGAT